MIDINLLPYEKKTSKALKRFIVIAVALFVLVAAAMFWYSIELDNQMKEIRTQEADWKAQADQRTGQSAAGQSADQAIRQLRDQQTPVHQSLAGLSDRLPDGTALTGLTYTEPDQLSASYTVPRFADIATLTDRLRQNNGFKSVITEQVTAVDDGFSVSLSLTIRQKKENGS